MERVIIHVDELFLVMNRYLHCCCLHPFQWRQAEKLQAAVQD